LLSFAASDPLRLDVTSPVLPLSTVKLMVAACWWDHESAQDKDLAESEHLLTDMIVYGGDAAGRQMASALRLKIGTAEVLNNLKHYGFLSLFASATHDKDETF
jgi:hypothetical protein